MFPFLMLSVLLLGTCLASPHVRRDADDELNHLKEKVNSLGEKLTFVEKAFFTVHRARSFATGSEKLYTTNEQEGNFEVTSATCTQAGGSIPSPKTEGEKKALQNVLERRNKTTYILNDNSAEANWAPGEPANADGTKNCVQIDKEGKWHAVSCDENNLIVCEFSFIA